MPTLRNHGDVPITTYFSVKPSDGRKRKPEARPGAKSTKKQRSETNKAPKVIVLDLQQGPTGASASTPSNSSGGGAARASLYPLTPKPPISNVLRQYNGPVLVHTTSTPADTGSSTHLKKKRSTLETPLSSNSLGSEFGNKTFPASRSSSQLHLRRPHNLLSECLDTPCQSSNTTTNHTRFSANHQHLSDGEDSLGVIPSSQSQNLLEAWPVLYEESEQAQNAIETSSTPVAGSSATAPQCRDACPSVFSMPEHDEVIPSSQSQFLSPLDHFPRKKRQKEHAATPEREVFNERIPSSQSQEMELALPDDEHEHEDTCTEDEIDDRPGLTKSKIPVRTRSDLLFPISIRKKVLAGIFSKAEFPGTHNAESSNENSLTDSETESDSTDTEIFSPRRSKSRLQTVPPQEEHSPMEAVSLEDQERITSLERTSELSENNESQGGSLPLAPTEFQEMFGNDDESYPPDFPMSLRV